MPPKLPTHSRSWGSHSDTSPLLSPVQSLHNMHNINDTTFLVKKKEDKLPHDASVFVGSLPSNIEQMDLTGMLMEHLSEHTQIKNIKVVRDSKGGVCAFVQCESATSATALLHTLHSSAPKPFMGRVLRYEPARAFRTLLVSYRTPTQMAHRCDISDSSDRPVLDAEIELELPNAMRIWKQRNSRFHSILYNSEAIEAQGNCELDDSLVTDNAVFLHPLAFDAEMLRTIASYFGHLESFIPLQILKNVRDDGGQTSNENPLIEREMYPAPHNAPRSPRMDNTCWEIKWDHRDDCVSALMTLRRVPHLAVTWAHQPVSSDHSNHPNHHQASGSVLYTLHAQDPSISAQQSSSSRTSMSDSGNIPTNVTHPHRHIEHKAFQGGVSGFTPDLHTSGLSHEARNSPRARLDACYPSPVGCDTILRTKHAHETNRTHSDKDDEEQELFIPQTPALDKSSVTPITPGSQFPVTPTSCDDNLHQPMRPKTIGEKENPAMSKDRELDPMTLFVGGLEMFGPGAWDEEKVKNFFARFGGLESVKVVRPLNSCAAFAFVKFNNAESPARAVFEEHNRVYEGRAMRVQLRDCNPPRSPWKHGRGRGRPQQTHIGIQRRLNYKLPYDAQDQNIRRDRTAPFKGPATNDDEIQLSSLVLQRTQKPSNVDMALPMPASSSDLASNVNTTPPTENYREWYDELESPARTPAPSSLGSSISTTGTSYCASPYSYPLPDRQFYPTPWMHPFMQQPPYHVPYYGSYPIYPGAAQNSTQPLPSAPGSNTSGPVTVPHWPHLSMYGSYIPYPVVPPRTHGTDLGQSQHLNTQAPLVPTGFIQNEQGTLVAVYQPEALDQYLARTQGTAASSATAPTNIGMQRWIPYTAHSCEPGGSVATNQGQLRSLPSLSAVCPQQLPDFQRSYPPFRVGDGTPSPLSRRHGGRREPQLPFTVGRSNPRLFGGRTFRPAPPMHNSGQAYAAEMRQQLSPSVPRSADWNKWNAGR